MQNTIAEYEKELIGAILHDAGTIDEYILSPDMFPDAWAMAIFEAIVATRGRVPEVNLVSISETLRLSGHADMVETLSSIDPWTSANAKYYAEKLREDMHRRKILPILKDAVAALETSPDSMPGSIRAIADGLVEIEKSKQEQEDPSIAKTFPKYCDELQRRLADDGKTGAIFGINAIDGLLGSNIGPGELVAIAARPGVGKTALAIQMAIHNSTRRNIPATIFSLEMTRNEIYDRIYAPVVQGGIQCLRGGFVIKSKSSLSRMEELTASINSSGVRIFQESMTPASLYSHIRREAMVYGTKLFVLDYLGLIDFGSDGKSARWEKVGDTSRSLKRLALDLGVTIIICVQLGRQADGKEPQLGDLRDSGAIEQDCNRVFLLHRASENGECGDFNTDFIAAKNRGGRTGKVPILFRGMSARFESAS